MSLLDETSATVLEYGNVTAGQIHLGQQAGIEGGINFVKLVGRVDLTGAVGNLNYPLLDVTTGFPLKVRGLLPWAVLQEANPALDDDGSLSYVVVGISNTDPTDYVQYLGNGRDQVNNKYLQVPFDDGVDGNDYFPNEYSTLGIRVDGSGTTTSGTVYVTFVGIRL